MSLTEPVDWVGKPNLGYMMNAEFSPANQSILADLNQKLQEQFGDTFSCPPPEALHITLLDFIAPLIDYDGQDKERMFEQLRAPYEQAMEACLAEEEPFVVTFDEIRVAPNTILIVGHDNGAFARIRHGFLSRVELVPGTKLPPDIIHSSLGRFVGAIPLEEVQQFVDSQRLHIEQPIASFRLVRSTRQPLLEYEVLKRYPL